MKIRNKLFASVKLLIIVFLRLDLRDRSDGNFGTNFACCEVFNIKAIQISSSMKEMRLELLIKADLDFVEKFTRTLGLYNCTWTLACSEG